MTRNFVRAAALGGVAALALTTAAPGYAATIVAQSSAAAFEVAIGGNAADSGRVTATATADGDGETTREQPPVGVLANQGLLNVGVATQQATADVINGNGLSAACAGIAGEGGSVVQVGESDCLTPGQPIDVSFANLDLTGTVVFREDSAFADLNAVTQALVDQAIGPITAAVSDGLSQFGTLEIGGTLGVVQARCNAEPGDADGSATLVDSEIAATVDFAGDEEPSRSVVLLDFPANPEPNTKVVTGLDKVANLLIEALETDLENSLDGALADLTGVTDEIQAQIIDAIVADIADQLTPLEENVIRATLNRQTSTGPGQIDVTALALDVLPAAEESPLAAPVVAAELANVTCGANDRVDAGTPDEPAEPDNTEGGGPLPEVPTAVDSGVSGEQRVDPALLAGGLLALAGAAGAVGYRRVRS